MKFIDIDLCIKLVKKACKNVKVSKDQVDSKYLVQDTVINIFNKGIDSAESIIVRWLCDILKGETYMYTEGGE